MPKFNVTIEVDEITTRTIVLSVEAEDAASAEELAPGHWQLHSEDYEPIDVERGDYVEDSFFVRDIEEQGG